MRRICYTFDTFCLCWALWALPEENIASRPISNGHNAQELELRKDSGFAQLSVASAALGSEADDFLLEYLPKSSRNEVELQNWYPKSILESKATAIHVLDLLPAKGTPCNILDVGANVGAFSEKISNVRSDCSVFAFEPIRELYSFNVDKHMNHTNVVLENLALCDTNGRRTMYRTKFGDLGRNTLEKVKLDGLTAEEIDCQVFDDYARTHGLMDKPVHALKIDVAGSEWRVLKGMHCFIDGQAPKPLIFMQIGWGKDKHPHWEAEKAEIEWLFAHGYKRRAYEFLESRDIIFRPIDFQE